MLAAGGDDVVGPVPAAGRRSSRPPTQAAPSCSPSLLDAVRGTAPGPLLLVVEDLHLAAPGTLAWLAFAGRRSRLAADRDDVAAAGARGGAWRRRRRRRPLDDDAAAVVAGTDCRAVIDRAAGNPLLLRALAATPDGPLPDSG